ncbi:MAG: isoprenylcysteine carboxylmethyltransferase family protein [Pseudomonadota bacterium]
MADTAFIFNPGRWPHRELISRITAMILVGLFMVVKVKQFHQYPGSFSGLELFYLDVNRISGQILYTHTGICLLWGLRLLTWGLETGILLGYILAYATREPARSLASGARETLVPVIVAGLPVLISMAPYTFPEILPYASPVHFPVSVMISGIIILGTAVNLVSLVTLRRSFSIMPEARGLVTRGIFRHIRHPIYLGHMILMTGVVLIRLHSYTLALFVLFCAGQCFRARMEEAKLMSALDGYGDYQARTGMFFPRFPWPGSG